MTTRIAAVTQRTEYVKENKPPEKGFGRDAGAFLRLARPNRHKYEMIRSKIGPA